MSRGFGGEARLIMQDMDTAIYEYYAYNLNEEGYENRKQIFDGLITIAKSSLVEANICEKLKKQPNGKKKVVVRRIKQEVDYSARISTKQISVGNSKFCWNILDNGIGQIAMRIIFMIFDSYQNDGTLPERVRCHV